MLIKVKKRERRKQCQSNRETVRSKLFKYVKCPEQLWHLLGAQFHSPFLSWPSMSYFGELRYPQQRPQPPHCLSHWHCWTDRENSEVPVKGKVQCDPGLIGCPGGHVQVGWGKAGCMVYLNLSLKGLDQKLQQRAGTLSYFYRHVTEQASQRTRHDYSSRASFISCHQCLSSRDSCILRILTPMGLR